MIKTIYRGKINSRYNSVEYFILFLLLMSLASIGAAAFTYWGLYLFTEFYGSQLWYITWAATGAVLVYWVSKWTIYVSQNQRGVFDVPKPKKVKKPKSSESSFDKEVVEDFVKGLRK